MKRKRCVTKRTVSSIWAVLQKELEKEIKKVADRQTEMAMDIQTMRKDMGSEFEKHNSNQITFKKQLQVKTMCERIPNLSD